MKRLLTLILAAILVAAMAVPVLAVDRGTETLGDLDANQELLAYFTGALNDELYGDGTPGSGTTNWNIANRIFVVKEDDVKHKDGTSDMLVYTGEDGYTTSKDPNTYGRHYIIGNVQAAINAGFTAAEQYYYAAANDNNDLVKPGVKIYASLNSFWIVDEFDDQHPLSIMDSKDLKVTVKKGLNSKYIESVKIVDKEFISSDISFVSDVPAAFPNTGLPGVRDDRGMEHNRGYYVEIVLKDSIIDKEIPITLKLEISAKKNIDASKYYKNGYNGYNCDSLDHTYAAIYTPMAGTIPSGTKITIESDRLYINNKVLNGDQNFSAGNHGVMVKPTKNDRGEVTWENANDMLARMKIYGDDNTDKFYAKLSTKWDYAEYDAEFGHTDAFVYSFTGNPKISDTSRATLELRNPFLNSDGDEIVAPEDVIIYELTEDGEYVDITSEFTYGETDDGEPMFSIKDRPFRTYIFSADPAAVELAQAEANVQTRFATGIFLGSKSA